jgi:gliding motility-associated-like protein
MNKTATFKRKVITITTIAGLFVSLFSSPLRAQITTGTITGSPFCGCDSVHVPFTSVGIFVAGNIYTAQLSDAVGSFATPVVIGTLASTANTDTIACFIPCGTLTGTGYLIRVTSSTPSFTGADNGVNLTINPTVTPSVSIAAVAAGTFCTDTAAVFTATSINGGGSPAYQWQINGANVGVNSAVYTASGVLAVGDTVSVILTSNAVCASVSQVNADTILACSAITTGGITGSPFCSCDSVAVPFTSIGVFVAGNVYTAQLSDSTGSFTSPTSIGTLSSIANIDTILCALPCSAFNGTAYRIRVIASTPVTTGTNNGTNLVIHTTVFPSVSIDATVAVAICIDTSVTFIATPTNGGSTPVYQWHKNNVNVGTNAVTYHSSGTLITGDSIGVTLTSNAVCASPASVKTTIPIACPQMEMTNVFSPNGDGVNDVFKINLSGLPVTVGESNFNINIYDRWGILVFNSPNINYKWDGRTTSGVKVACGTYFYILDLNGQKYKGSLTVLE